MHAKLPLAFTHYFSPLTSFHVFFTNIGKCSKNETNEMPIEANQGPQYEYFVDAQKGLLST
jgi:hypothetical protein